MKVLVVSPISLSDIGGPATVAREFLSEFTKRGDTAEVVTFTLFERRLPPGFRQAALFFRLVFSPKPDAVLLLDPASTGPSAALAAWVTGVPSILRVGGDFLWESWVARTRMPVLLSEFYSARRRYSSSERLIYLATRFTCTLTHHIVFTTSWQRDLWLRPYQLSSKKITVVGNGLPDAVPSAARGKVFLCIGRRSFLKNTQVIEKLWPEIAVRYPEAVLDTAPRSPEAYRAALRDAYAVIVPSLSEVSPNAVLEAIAFGKPFITTRDTGIYEEYQDAGAFVDTRDQGVLRHSIEALLTPDGYERALQKVLAHRKRRVWSDAFDEYRSILRSIMHL